MSTYYNLQILQGLSSNRSLLSCAPDGKVDLWDEDDGSGRQRWILESLGQSGPREEETYQITVHGGTSDPDKKHLSVASDGRTVTLDALYGDGHTNQNLLWYLVPVSAGPPKEPESYFNLIPVTIPGSFLSCSEDGTVVDVWNADDGSGRQRWQLQGPYFDPASP